MSGVNSSKFINRYENNAQYVADASERAALGRVPCPSRPTPARFTSTA